MDVTHPILIIVDREEVALHLRRSLPPEHAYAVRIGEALAGRRFSAIVDATSGYIGVHQSRWMEEVRNLKLASGCEGRFCRT